MILPDPIIPEGMPEEFERVRQYIPPLKLEHLLTNEELNKIFEDQEIFDEQQCNQNYKHYCTVFTKKPSQKIKKFIQVTPLIHFSTLEKISSMIHNNALLTGREFTELSGRRSRAYSLDIAMGVDDYAFATYCRTTKRQPIVLLDPKLLQEKRTFVTFSDIATYANLPNRNKVYNEALKKKSGKWYEVLRWAISLYRAEMLTGEQYQDITGRFIQEFGYDNYREDYNTGNYHLEDSNMNDVEKDMFLAAEVKIHKRIFRKEMLGIELKYFEKEELIYKYNKSQIEYLDEIPKEMFYLGIEGKMNKDAFDFINGNQETRKKLNKEALDYIEQFRQEEE